MQRQAGNGRRAFEHLKWRTTRRSVLVKTSRIISGVPTRLVGRTRFPLIVAREFARRRMWRKNGNRGGFYERRT